MNLHTELCRLIGSQRRPLRPHAPLQPALLQLTVPPSLHFMPFQPSAPLFNSIILLRISTPTSMQSRNANPLRRTNTLHRRSFLFLCCTCLLLVASSSLPLSSAQFTPDSTGSGPDSGGTTGPNGFDFGGSDE